MNTQNKAHWIWAAISAISVVAVVGIGAWWTAVAAYEGQVGAMLFRFCLSVAAGVYYMVLHRLATGRSLKFKGAVA